MKHSESLQARLREFFRANPDEYLTLDDIAVKFGCSRGQAQTACMHLRNKGELTTMTVTLRPIGRGNHSSVLLTYVPRLRTEQPTAVEWYRGQRVMLGGLQYRVSMVSST